MTAPNQPQRALPVNVILVTLMLLMEAVENVQITVIPVPAMDQESVIHAPLTTAWTLISCARHALQNAQNVQVLVKACVTPAVVMAGTLWVQIRSAKRVALTARNVTQMVLGNVTHPSVIVNMPMLQQPCHVSNALHSVASVQWDQMAKLQNVQMVNANLDMDWRKVTRTAMHALITVIPVKTQNQMATFNAQLANQAFPSTTEYVAPVLLTVNPVILLLAKDYSAARV
jgi:hypothetical protein